MSLTFVTSRQGDSANISQSYVNTAVAGHELENSYYDEIGLVR
jgi:hypothetical protein